MTSTLCKGGWRSLAAKIQEQRKYFESRPLGWQLWKEPSERGTCPSQWTTGHHA